MNIWEIMRILQEELEMARVTVSFIESHALELEALRNQEIKKREKLEQDYKVTYVMDFLISFLTKSLSNFKP